MKMKKEKNSSPEIPSKYVDNTENADNELNKELNKEKDIFKFLFKEKEIVKKLKIREELIIPLLFSIKYGGSWSYSNESGDYSISVKDRTTIFDENSNTGFTKEVIYLLINPEIIKKRGTIFRLEKCGNRKERILVKRAYEVWVKADRIIVAKINPKTRKIVIKDENINEILLKPPLSYSFMHEYEHVKRREIEGEDIFKFDIVYKKG